MADKDYSQFGISSFFKRVWKKFLSYPRWFKILIGVLILAVVGGILIFVHNRSKNSDVPTEPTVTVQSIQSFGSNTQGIDVLGTVQSVSEADLLAQSAGTVEAVNTTLGAQVPAGFVIANLDGAAASASVLQAQGAYDAAVAAAKATTLEAQNTTASLPAAKTAVLNTYQSIYTSLESTLTGEVDQLFGDITAVGPELAINPLTTGTTFPRERRDITASMATWQESLATANTQDPVTLLSSAQTWLTSVSTFLTNLSTLATSQGSGATTAQLTALSTAQSTVNTLLANVNAARTTYTTAQTAAAVSQTQGADSDGEGVTSAEASVEEALGALRAAQAAYEKTVIRAPIAGTINFLPISVGDYASLNEHVATVARNNALEIIMQVSQTDAGRLVVGNSVSINGTDSGVVTAIAPALSPTTNQIEVDIAVNDGSDLVNGQSVQVALPALLPAIGSVGSSTPDASDTSSTPPSTTSELPLTAVKLLPNERDVFTVDATGHLVAHQVQIGDVIGDRVQILTPLDPTLEIVIDVRGLSAGDAVVVSTTAPATDASE